MFVSFASFFQGGGGGERTMWCCVFLKGFGFIDLAWLGLTCCGELDWMFLRIFVILLAMLFSVPDSAGTMVFVVVFRYLNFGLLWIALVSAGFWFDLV